MAITDSITESEFDTELNLKNIALPLVQRIASEAFRTPELTSLFIPEAISIGDHAFTGSLLTTLSLPKATQVGSYAFIRSPLTSLSLPKANKIGRNAFNSIQNAKTTLVTMSAKFNTPVEKDKIFGIGN